MLIKRIKRNLFCEGENIFYKFIFSLITIYILYKSLFLYKYICFIVIYFDRLIYMLISNNITWLISLYSFIFSTIITFISISYIGLYGVFLINLLTLFVFWISTLFIFLDIITYNTIYVLDLGNWFNINSNYNVSFEILIDLISISFIFLTTTIGLFSFIYAYSYFRYEPLVERLLLFLNIFIISMILLVSAGNIIIMFLGWELIGLTSFFLINFWSSKISTFKAAFKAYTFNKLSDFFLLIFIIIIYNYTNCINIIALSNQLYLFEKHYINIGIFNINIIEITSLLLILCAFIKSAQIGFHIWLPDSMEAPVPASALIHSATLVSAGLYLLIRFNFLIDLSVRNLFFIKIAGIITAFYGGIVSACQSDTKKLLAYSTISHCGFLMVIYSTGLIEYTILYLYVHGFFKAIIFMCIGNVNRFNKGIQDFKKMGNLYKYLPFECFTTFISLINLSGLPLTIGFYIKHLLFIGLEDGELFIITKILTFMLIIAAVSGIFYSYRLFYNIFFDFKKSKKYNYINSHEFNLNSKYYTNTSLGSNISITFLFIISYIVILYLYSNIISTYYNTSDFNIFFFKKNIFYYFNFNINFLTKISILNWCIIILLLSTFLINWRYSNNNIFINFSKINLYLIFFFLNFKFF